jgi:CRISPR-associated protein Cas4
MEHLWTMTQLNDFIFCPRSLYYGGIYRNTGSIEIYHQAPQLNGRAAHAAVDQVRYSSRKNILQGTTVYCEKYNLVGKIDTFDIASGLLTERKNSITAVYDGFRFQLYAQCFALSEMGYEVKEMRLYSAKDNIVYPIPLPTLSQVKDFEHTLKCMQEWTPEREFLANPKKCRACIYSALCDCFKE